MKSIKPIPAGQLESDRKVGTGIGTTVGTTETLMYSHKIDAGKAPIGTNIVIDSLFEKNGTTSTLTSRYRLSTDGTIANSVIIGNFIFPSANRFMPFKRKSLKVISGNLLKGYSFTTSLISDDVASSVAMTTTPFNPANNYWLLATAQMTGGTDVGELFNVNIEL